MKKFNFLFFMAFVSLSSVFAQAPTWSLASPLMTGDWHANATALYANRLEYKIYEAPAIWDPATSNVMDVWNLLPVGTPLNNYFVDAAKKRTPVDAADFSGTVKYMYDLDNLYVLFKATDDYIFPLDSVKQEGFELMYAPYADSIKMADLFVIDPAFKDTIAKNKWMIDSRQSLCYWGKAGAYKTTLTAKGTGGSYLGLEAAYTTAGTVNWGAPIANLGITTKFTKLSATEYTYLVTVPFVTGMKNYVPVAGNKIAIELKVVDKDTGKPLNIEAASNTNNNDLYIHNTEGKDDMPAHIKSSLTNSNLTISIKNNKLILGTWQGIYLFEHRIEPQARKVFLHLIGQ